MHIKSSANVQCVEEKINFVEQTPGIEIGKEVFQLAQNWQTNRTGRVSISSELGVKFPLEFQLEKEGVCI